MAPIPRCDLRLPSEPSGRRSSQHTTPKSDTADKTSTKSPSYTSERPVLKVGSGRAPLHSQRSSTRDSAEILEGAPEFSTGVTRDSGEVREHQQHEGAGSAEGVDGIKGANGAEEADGLGEAGGPGGAGLPEGVEGTPLADCPDPCTVLEQSRSEIEAEAAAATAAVVDEEDVTTAAEPEAAPGADLFATPGDVCAQFCQDRPESPSSGYSIHKAIGASKIAKKRGLQTCKGTYGSLETYKSLWGSSKAVSARKKLELDMKKKRKYYERLHERNKRRREKERRRAKEKRRMLRCCDQSKIPETIGNISINKAFYFRFNYNNRLPFMPSAMDQHLKRFKRPPFRRYHKGSRRCRKLVDEFEKLRVPHMKAGHSVTTRPPAQTKA